MTRCLLRTGAVVVVVVLLTATAAKAAFNANPSASASYATATLAAPTNLSASAGPCVVAVSASVVLGWTATASTWADGYEVLRSLLAGGPRQRCEHAHVHRRHRAVLHDVPLRRPSDEGQLAEHRLQRGHLHHPGTDVCLARFSHRPDPDGSLTLSGRSVRWRVLIATKEAHL
jgi:hypothetical protein